MRGKFGFDVGKLKIGSSKEFYRDYLPSPLDSRPPTPKSVRPPLPDNINAELRAACTYIVNHPKPSHEIWSERSRPVLDYAAIKAQANTSQPAIRNQSISTKVSAKHDTPLEAQKYTYKPTITTEDLFGQSEWEERLNPQIDARFRADQLMAPIEPLKLASCGPKAPAGSHSRATASQQQKEQISSSSVSGPKHDIAVRTRMSGRSDSIGTTDSTPHTDTTDYPWSASTPMTSAAITPARSKRASSQNVNATNDVAILPKIDTANADWMRTELEKHRKAIEERERREQESEKASSPEATSPPAPSHTSSPLARVPTRKPVPSRPGSRQPRDTARPSQQSEDEQDVRPVQQDRGLQHSRGRFDSATQVRPAPSDAEVRGRGMKRSSSRSGQALRAASRAASKAANRAGSITNELLGHYIRPGKTQPQSPVSPSNHMESLQVEAPKRSASRSRHISEQVKGYIRSASRAGSRKPSMDVLRGHSRTESSTSYHSGNTNGAQSEHSSSRWRGWRSRNKSVNAIEPEISRPVTSNSTTADEKDSSQSPVQQRGRPLDLNRELPPLPGLDQWKSFEDLDPREQAQRVRETAHSIESSGHGRSKASLPKHSDLTLKPNDGAELSRVRTTPNQRPSESLGKTPYAHSRADSSKVDRARGPSIDEYNRMLHARYQHTLEVPAQSSAGVAKEKMKWKWWQQKDRSQGSWMDQVAKSGARNGILQTDEVAGAPVVRY